MKLKQVGQFPNFYLDEVSGIYYVRKMVRGIRVDRSTGFKTEKSAFKRYLEILRELDETKAGWTAKKVPTLSEWWKTYRQAKVKSESSWALHEGRMERDVLPELGRTRLDDLTQSRWERFFSALRRRQGPKGQPWSDSTVRGYYTLLHALMQSAVDEGYVDKNPLKKVWTSGFTTRKRVLSIEEQQKVYEQLSPMVQRWFVFLLGTGLRVSEVRSIDPSRDLDRLHMLVRVKGKGFMGRPKYREVPLLDKQLLDIIDAQVRDNATNSPLHRMERVGTLWAQEPTTFRVALYTACKTTGVKQFSPHVLRHTFATRYLQAGGNIYVLSKILGHSRVAMTERVYAHLLTQDLTKLSAHVKLQLPSSPKETEGKLLPFMQK